MAALDIAPTEWEEFLGAPLRVTGPEDVCTSAIPCSNVAVWHAVLSHPCGHIATDFCDPCADMADAYMEYCQNDPDEAWPPICRACQTGVYVVRWERMRQV